MKREELLIEGRNAQGERTYGRFTADGAWEEGVIVEGASSEGGDFLLETESLGGPVHKITREIPFTARSRPATPAYRLGWERTFRYKDAPS